MYALTLTTCILMFSTRIFAMHPTLHKRNFDLEASATATAEKARCLRAETSCTSPRFQPRKTHIRFESRAAPPKHPPRLRNSADHEGQGEGLQYPPLCNREITETEIQTDGDADDMDFGKLHYTSIFDALILGGED
ncbi:hypothetical protein EJ08DRAFT_693769 [Tothia fuscella]|uniref:Uncharacterized protein n=1 Tax=Tothia fuscella TaxID=1048955 RepID=A0A9P4U2R7_9PEZI|nr:hypothetical protein EJ08DRAFT_693769 [Tothia fuscella]